MCCFTGFSMLLLPPTPSLNYGSVAFVIFHQFFFTQFVFILASSLALVMLIRSHCLTSLRLHFIAIVTYWVHKCARPSAESWNSVSSNLFWSISYLSCFSNNLKQIFNAPYVSCMKAWINCSFLVYKSLKLSRLGTLPTKCGICCIHTSILVAQYKILLVQVTSVINNTLLFIVKHDFVKSPLFFNASVCL